MDMRQVRPCSGFFYKNVRALGPMSSFVHCAHAAVGWSLAYWMGMQ
jgi:hypothetical protein